LGTRLVSDLPGNAHVQDPNLVDPIGIAFSQGSPDWVSNSGSGVATLYNTLGQAIPLVVSVQPPGNPVVGSPTGDVFNLTLGAGNGCQVTDGLHTAPADFLFATTSGAIVGWSPSVDPSGRFEGPGGVSTFGAIAVKPSTSGADYRGLTMAGAGASALLYAANFGQATVDVFDSHFAP